MLGVLDGVELEEIIEQRAWHDALHLELRGELGDGPLDPHRIDYPEVHARIDLRSCRFTCE